MFNRYYNKLNISIVNIQHEEKKPFDWNFFYNDIPMRSLGTSDLKDIYIILYILRLIN